MNRPNIEDYKLKDGGYSQKYITDLEKYCDKLKDRCLSDEWNLQLLNKDCLKLEIALDAACYMLERFDKICHSVYPMTKKQWKDWLMGDE